MPEYTLAAVIALVLVVGAELLIARTGIFRLPAYWISMVIVLGFQVLVDGWLTKLSAPIVVYDDTQNLGIRVPWDIPIEDFAFAFAMVTLTLMLWLRATTRRPRPRPGSDVDHRPDDAEVPRDDAV